MKSAVRVRCQMLRGALAVTSAMHIAAWHATYVWSLLFLVRLQSCTILTNYIAVIRVLNLNVIVIGPTSSGLVDYTCEAHDRSHLLRLNHLRVDRWCESARLD